MALPVITIPPQTMRLEYTARAFWPDKLILVFLPVRVFGWVHVTPEPVHILEPHVVDAISPGLKTIGGDSLVVDSVSLAAPNPYEVHVIMEGDFPTAHTWICSIPGSRFLGLISAVSGITRQPWFGNGII